MPYTAQSIGLRQAVTQAVQNMLAAMLPDLNAALRFNSNTTRLITQGSWKDLVASESVVRGDASVVWPATEGAVRIFVSHAAPQNGLSREAAIEYAEFAQKRLTFHTFVSMVIHPDAFRWEQGKGLPQRQATQREDALAVMEDWLSAVLSDHAYMQAYTQPGGVVGNSNLVLASSNYQNPDILKNCYARMIFREMYTRGLGGSEGMFGVHGVHTGSIA